MLAFSIATAAAQLAPGGRPEVPGAGIASEDGPGAGWVNPANLAYDPDPRWGVYGRWSPTGGGSVAGAAGMGGAALGAAAAPGATGTRVSLDASAGAPLGGRLAVGATGRLGVGGDDGRTVASADLGVSFRPTEGFGISAVGRGVLRSADPTLPLTGLLGVALRPSERVLFGLEGGVIASRPVGAGDRADLHPLARGTGRLRAAEGLWIRAWGGLDRGDPEGGLALEFHGGGAALGLAGHGGPAPGGGAWLGSGEEGEDFLSRDGVVPVVDLGRPPAYQPPRGPLAGDVGPAWMDVLTALREAGEDPDVAGAVVVVGRGLGAARQAELRARILALEADGRRVTAYVPGSVDTGGYWAVSPASRVVVHPAGSLDVVGVAVELQSIRGLMDLVGVEAQVARQGAYKSAGEFYTNTDPSPEQLEQVGAYLDDVHAELVRGIAEARQLPEEEVRGLLDGAPWSAEEAVARRLADAVAFPDELEREVRLAIADSPRLRPLPRPSRDRSAWRADSRVAVIYVDGAIVSGPSGSGGLLGGRRAGAATVVEQLDRARREDRVKAVVLRVESPGGSVLASEDILRAVKRVQRDDKPVVVSMGSVAGSGGYYVAASADAIWAHPSTLTGSIGVIATKISPSPLLDRLGVTVTPLGRGENATMESTFTPWDDAERERVQALVDGMYERFKGHVADGRALGAEAVEEAARGRIWSGRAAAGQGLVDHLGGLQDAVDDAAARAGLDPAEARVVSWRPAADLGSLLGPDLPLGSAAWVPLLGPLGAAALFVEHPDERVWAIDPWISGLP